MRLILIALFILVLSIAASAQDTVKLTASFANTDLSLDDIQGVQVELDAKIYKYDKVRVGGVFHYVRPQFGAIQDFDTYSFGPQLSYDLLGGTVSVFGRVMFGLTTDYSGTNASTHTFGAGVDLNLGHVVIRPLVVDRVRIEGVPISVERYGAGVGVRF